MPQWMKSMAGWCVALAATGLVVAMPPARAEAGETPVVKPAVLQTTDDQQSSDAMQLVHWRRRYYAAPGYSVGVYGGWGGPAVGVTIGPRYVAPVPPRYYRRYYYQTYPYGYAYPSYNYYYSRPYYYSYGW